MTGILLTMTICGACAGQVFPAPEGQASGVPAAAGDVVLHWNEAVLAAIREERTPPPLAARNLAIVHAAIYDAINAVQKTYRPYRVAVAAPLGTSAEAAGAVAAHRVLVTLYPRQVARFDDALDASLSQVAEGPGRAAGVSLGQSVAEGTLEWRRGDNAGRTVAYKPLCGLGMWLPTPPEYRPPLLPQWSQVTCFALQSGAQFRPKPPPALTSAAYAAAFEEVRALGHARSQVRSADQTQIAYFWEGGEGTGTPPGHWNDIARAVARCRGLTPAENARLFALLNLALADAAIACWDCKYQFNLWRPVHAIRVSSAYGDPRTPADPAWQPLLVTPPFPTYTSGHSTFSGTGAAALAAFFGRDDVPFSIGSDSLPGVQRSFSGFWAAAQEAGRSRIYGGIHWEFDNSEGLQCGRQVGEYVCRHYLLPRVLTAPPVHP